MWQIEGIGHLNENIAETKNIVCLQSSLLLAPSVGNMIVSGNMEICAMQRGF